MLNLKKPSPQKIPQKRKNIALQDRHQHLLFAPPSHNCLPFRGPMEKMKMSSFEGPGKIFAAFIIAKITISSRSFLATGIF